MNSAKSVTGGTAEQRAEARMDASRKAEPAPTKLPKESEEGKGMIAREERKSAHEPQRQAMGPREDLLCLLERIVIKGTTDVEKEIKILRKTAERQFLSLEGS